MRGVGLAAGLVAGAMLVAACSSSDAGAKASTSAQLTITPGDATEKARPDQGITVTAAGGKLEQVTVQANGQPVEGAFSPDHTSWQTKWTLQLGTPYQVSAAAKNAKGQKSTRTASFTTLKYTGQAPAASLDWILEANKGETYGIGLPIILNFDMPVYNKQAVEKALEVTAEKPVEGSWFWYDNKTVIYRTKEYWQPHQKVVLTAHLAGVRTGKDVYAKKDFTRTFEIGKSQISHIDLKRHRMQVTVDGVKRPSYGISAGNGSTSEYTTSSGIHLTMDKGNPVIMESPNRRPGDPGYYKEPISYAVRISSLGEYVHQTPGDEWALGNSNVSHGCVRQPGGQARWFYSHVQPGDVVISKGTGRQLSYDNGWGWWQRSWENWLKGSAFYQPPATPTPSPSDSSAPTPTPTG